MRDTSCMLTFAALVRAGSIDMTWETILIVCAGVVTLSSAINAIVSWVSKPATTESRIKALEEHEKNDLVAIRANAQALNDLEKRVGELEKKTEEIADALQMLQTETGMTVRALMHFITHVIDGGNNMDKLKAVRMEMYEHLLEVKRREE